MTIQEFIDEMQTRFTKEELQKRKLCFRNPDSGHILIAELREDVITDSFNVPSLVILF